MKALLFCALLLGPAPFLSADQPFRLTHELAVDGKTVSADEHARLRKVRAKLYEIVLPEVSLSKVSLREALDWVSQATSKVLSKGEPPGRTGVNISARFRGAEEQITLRMRRATLPQVLEAICAQRNYVWGLDSNALFLVPEEYAPVTP